MSDDDASEFLSQLQVRQTLTARREFRSRCLLATLLAMAVLATAIWRLWLGAPESGFGVFGISVTFAGWTISIPDWLPEHALRTLVVISFVAFGSLALLHFSVVRPAAQACRQQRTLALMVELEQALVRQRVSSAGQGAWSEERSAGPSLEVSLTEGPP